VSLDALRREGIVVTSFDALVGDDALWARLQEDVAAFAAEVEPRADKLLRRETRSPFVVRRFRKSPLAERPGLHTYALDDPWLRLATSPAILELVNGYRGEPALLADLDLWYVIATAERAAAQEWRRAPWDEHVVKVFLYHSASDEETGFQYVRGSQTGGRYGGLWPSAAGEEAVYPPPDDLLAQVAGDDVLRVTAEPGTLVVCDASGFHRGWWARTPQLLSYSTYISPGSTHARKYLETANPGLHFRVDWGAGEDSLGEPARLALAWSRL
jgi:hypothetical protein